jgi:hypothetical protein
MRETVSDGDCGVCGLELSALGDSYDHCPLCLGAQSFATLQAFSDAQRRWACAEKRSKTTDSWPSLSRNAESVMQANGGSAHSWAAIESGVNELSDQEYEAFHQRTFVLGTTRDVFAAYKRRERLELVCDPFARAPCAQFASVGPSSERTSAQAFAQAGTLRVPLRSPSPGQAQAARFEPGAVRTRDGLDSAGVAQPSRVLLYPLASVAASDGSIGVTERWYIDECMKRYGLSQVLDAELRVYYPLDYARCVPVAFRELLLSEMCALAMVDGLPDAAEARMIYAYCTEWRIPEGAARTQLLALQKHNTSFARRAWLRFRNYLLPGRWEQTTL